MGPPEREDIVTPHTRPPADNDADHLLVRTVECLEGRVEVELVCEPVFDYGRTPAEWTLVEGSRHAADATGAGQTIRLHTDMALGSRRTRFARGTTSIGATGSICALSWGRRSGGAGRRRRRRRPDRHHRPDSGGTGSDGPGSPTIAGGTRSSDPPSRSRASPSRRRARRSPPSRRRCRRPPAASATGTTATAGCATRRSRSKRCTGSTSTGRPRSSSSSSPTSNRTTTAGCRSCTASTAGATSPSRRATTSPATTGARPVRIGNGAFDQRQNDVFGAVLDSILLHTRRSQRLPRRTWPIVQAQAECATNVWQEPDQGIWEARGAPQHYVSSKLMCWVAMDRAAKLAGDPRRSLRSRRIGRRPPTRSRPTSSSTASGRTARCGSTTRRTASTRRACSRPIFGFLPRGGRTPPGDGRWRSPRTSPRTASSSVTGPTRPTTACPGRRAAS